LQGQCVFDLFVLLFGEFHHLNFSQATAIIN
jgi:hypothetical protein